MERFYPVLFAATVACAVGGMYLFLQSQKAQSAAVDAAAAQPAAQPASVRNAVQPLENKVCVIQAGKKDC